MRLSISNIAWDVSEDETISSLLSQYNIDAIDIAPGKYFPEPTQAKENDILKVRQWWFERGIEITGMQALLFGRKELNLFSSAEIQNTMLDYLAAICRIGSHLGVTRLVFGSPKNRDRSGLDEQRTIEIAVSFFRRLGDIAQTQGMVVCLEPNPLRYGANFMTTNAETAVIVEQVGHPAIKMQLDTGATAINSEDMDTVLSRSSHLIGHIHASEPDLLPLGDGCVDHAAMSRALRKHPTTPRLICIEMASTNNEFHAVSVERALCCAIKYYRKKPENLK